MEYIKNENQGKIALAICEAIHVNASYLSEIDGATGDGDHGVNMNKGFLMAKERLSEEMSFTESMKVISRTLVEDIGGSMGPIYGTMFSKLSKATKGKDEISKGVLLEAFQLALQGLCDLAGAKVGDKTLIDTLNPAIEAYQTSLMENATFKDALLALQQGAESGKENTKNLVAKIGRAARLGERSRGFLDAGATSCCIIIKTMANEISKQL
ncbi:dihydroxyacetone kinase subunit DhaL [Amedibacillus sp. YH-ame6]